MSGQPAVSGAAGPRVLVIDEGKLHDVFEVLDVSDTVVRMRSPFLFEVGEEMRVQIERNGTSSVAVARVRAHITDPAGKITELALSDISAVAG